MERTKEQILMDKLRSAGKKARAHGGRPSPEKGPHRPVPPGAGGPHNPGMVPPPRGPHGPGMPPPPPPFGFGGRPLPRERVLLTLLEAGDRGIRQKDVAEELGINASSLSEQLDRLETQRYLERRANPEDRRSTLLVLTEKGKARAWEVLDERRQAAEHFCKNLTEEEKDILIRLLDKLLEEEKAG